MPVAGEMNENNFIFQTGATDEPKIPATEFIYIHNL